MILPVGNTTRRSARRKRDAWLLFTVLLLGIGTIVTLSHDQAQQTGQGSGTLSQAVPTAATTSAPGGTPAPAASVLTGTAPSHLYPFPQSNVGLMQPDGAP